MFSNKNIICSDKLLTFGIISRISLGGFGDLQVACQRALCEEFGASRRATCDGACSHPSFDPSPGSKMLGAVGRKKIQELQG